ncbi:hypothetical protein JRO89_XS13G0226800 [Xanthoceras sorbifolium]|uniref:C2H2-type domain-containing protein n=1 Tax=Xanthoceras sorbifolium TaxID=99658 RepID=A0ABQ8H9K8_9ROSI|nr:hypothetical protein JRO89_XS13G0226800 [Xanthoceras sorbifolium]
MPDNSKSLNSAKGEHEGSVYGGRYGDRCLLLTISPADAIFTIGAAVASNIRMHSPTLIKEAFICCIYFVACAEEEVGSKVTMEEKAIFRDIRRYYCEYCGICRSKKSLISSHILSHHKEEKNEKRVDGDPTLGVKSNTCEECGATFKKPAYLKQHMQSHSFERAFRCPVDDCHASYRRKDHLTRHLLQHQGKLFKCPIENCNREFAYQGNIKRHLKEIHDEDSSITIPKQYVCQEAGCAKVFKYASKLRKHEDAHGKLLLKIHFQMSSKFKLDSVEAFCSEQGCMKYFTNKQCLEAHVRSCHQHIACEICGSRQLKKNIKRHMHTHEERGSYEKFECEFKGCQLTFSTKSNLQQHVKAVHHEIKPYACGIVGCGIRFAYKHVRDKHEKSGCHVYATGDFIESDEQFRSRPRGGRKRKCPTVEMLIRKRVCPPSPTDEVFGN